MQDTSVSNCEDRPPQLDVPVTDWINKFDEESIQELMNHYKPLLREIIRRHWDRRLQRRVGVSDVMQLTWISIATQNERKRFLRRESFVGFLKKTLINHLVNTKRSSFAKKRSLAREFNEVLGKDQDLYLIAKGSPSALDQLIERELAYETLKAILQLPRELQRLLRWRFRKGMSYSEIAGKIDRKEDDVRYLIDKCVNVIAREMRTKSRLAG
jgi:RNA polymerase sigma factor (sigma-70 family)